jgi:hypothetical protein
MFFGVALVIGMVVMTGWMAVQLNRIQQVLPRIVGTDDHMGGSGGEISAGNKGRVLAEPAGGWEALVDAEVRAQRPGLSRPLNEDGAFLEDGADEASTSDMKKEEAPF